MILGPSSAGRGACAWGTALISAFLLVTSAAIVDASLAAANAQQSQMQRQPASPQAQGQRAGPQTGQERRSGPAHSQVQGAISAEFRTALEPHGRWQRHSRWGEVWTPANRPRDWRPYTAGHWVYTDDWGWYWISDESEARWGWATYHYGRWIFDDELGWCWVAGDEWSPAWVQWRRGQRDVEYVGWAPLPPDEIIVEYRDEPRFWIFVRGRDFIAPRIVSVILPMRQYDVFVRDTVIVNRTVVVGDRSRFAVNPGISPGIVAAFSGRPLRTYDVRPVVLAGTTPIQGAVQVRAQDARSRDFRARTTVRQTQNVVRAAERVQAPQPLAAGEHGRLGDTPPRAARRAPGTAPTTGQAPAQQQPQQQGQPPPPAAPQQPAQQQGRAKQEPAQTKQEPARTQGRGSEPQRQKQQGAAPQREQPAAQPQQRPSTEGRAVAPQRQQPQSERRAVSPPRQPQAGRSAPPPRQPPSTQGRSGPPAQAAPQPRAQPSATEGRGGGGGPKPGGAPPPQRGPGGGGPGKPH